jgi:hypothetical protein
MAITETAHKVLSAGTVQLTATENIYRTRGTAGFLNAVDERTLVKIRIN